MKRLLIALSLGMAAHAALAQEPVDYVDLGARLLKDGYVERAKNVLEKADVTAKGFDFARYYTLKGILLNRLSYPDLSNIFFAAAAEHGQRSPSIQLYIAKNYWSLHDYPRVIEALDRAGPEVARSEQMMVIKAESYKQQGLFDEAWAVLDEGIELFPESASFYRQKFYYLLELGFYQRAADYAQKFLALGGFQAKDYLALGFVLREKGRLSDAAALLEEAAIKHPDDDKVIELLGQVYIDQEQYLAAALVYDWSSIEHPEFAYKAATLYLKAGQPVRAQQLNRRVLKQDDKFRQRVSIDIVMDDYEALVSTVPALKRYDLLRDDNIVYAVGYAYFQIGDYANAKTYLQRITDSELFSKASTIFDQIEKCQGEPLECS